MTKRASRGLHSATRALLVISKLKFKGIPLGILLPVTPLPHHSHPLSLSPAPTSSSLPLTPTTYPPLPPLQSWTDHPCPPGRTGGQGVIGFTVDPIGSWDTSITHTSSSTGVQTWSVPVHTHMVSESSTINFIMSQLSTEEDIFLTASEGEQSSPETDDEMHSSGSEWLPSGKYVLVN